MVAIQRQVRINERIRVPEVRVVGPAGEQLGVMLVSRALELANQHELDLVEVAATASPPVCRIMDFSKYKYDQEKKEREMKKHQKQSQLKEIRVKPHIEEHDYQVKLKQLVAFLKKKDKVKVSLFFRGREMAHQDIGQNIINRFIADIQPVGQVEKGPLMEGRILTMTIAPR